jgi:hypothetical protein
VSRAATPPAQWQFPWLRVSLIIQRLERACDECPEDLAVLRELRAQIEVSGWFN